MKIIKNKPPGHLSTESKKFWVKLVFEYNIDDPAGLKILQVSLEAFDRAQAARKIIKKDGMTIVDKNLQIKSHPLLAVERDNRAAFLAGLKALNLDMEPLKGIGRPAGR